eukprot:COSAG01_NODE_3463_length_6066_cov_2.711916_2_plen_253_part_00
MGSLSLYEHVAQASCGTTGNCGRLSSVPVDDKFATLRRWGRSIVARPRRSAAHAHRPTGRCWVQRGVLNCLFDAVQHSRMRRLWTSAAVCRTVAPSSVGAASIAARTPGVRLSTAAAGLVVRRGLRDGTGTGISTRTVAGRPAPATIEYEGRSYANSMRVPFEVRVISDVMGSGVVAAAPIKCGAEIFHEADVVEVRPTDRLPPRAPNSRSPRDPWNPPHPRPAHTPWPETASLRELASCVPSSCMGARAAP